MIVVGIGIGIAFVSVGLTSLFWCCHRGSQFWQGYQVGAKGSAAELVIAKLEVEQYKLACENWHKAANVAISLYNEKLKEAEAEEVN